MTISMEPDATTKGVDPATATYTLSQANPTLQLAANTQYNATVTFNDDIEDEVTEEGTDHELFYVANPASLFSNITKTDMDANNRPIGLAATVTTGAAGTGTLVVTLKHQPGLKGSTSNPNVGETDVQANFNVIIQ